jgi:hypothetical protein
VAKKKHNALTERQIENGARKAGEAAEELRAALEEADITCDDLLAALPEARKLVYEQHYGEPARRRVNR